MKNGRKIVAASVLSLAMGVTSITAFAAAKYDSPQDALVGITGKTVEEITEKKVEENKTYGAIAAEEGVLEEFKVELMEQKKDVIEKRVSEGNLVQEEADKILERIQERQETCVGEGHSGEGMMEGNGLHFGDGSRDGLGNGSHHGEGHGLKDGTAQGNRPEDGSGYGTRNGHGHGKGLGRNK